MSTTLRAVQCGLPALLIVASCVPGGETVDTSTSGEPSSSTGETDTPTSTEPGETMTVDPETGDTDAPADLRVPRR